MEVICKADVKQLSGSPQMVAISPQAVKLLCSLLDVYLAFESCFLLQAWTLVLVLSNVDVHVRAINCLFSNGKLSDKM